MNSLNPASDILSIQKLFNIAINQLSTYMEGFMEGIPWGFLFND